MALPAGEYPAGILLLADDLRDALAEMGVGFRENFEWKIRGSQEPDATRIGFHKPKLKIL